jgi:uncharacterized damage-inducible protein DinB
MANVEVVNSGFNDYFRTMQKRVHELVGPLSQQQLWTKPYTYGNSIGNLILHLTGNLNYYIGARMGETGYVRDRDLEFRDSGKAKEELLRKFDRAIEVVVQTVSKQSATDWAAPYTAERTQMHDRFSMVLNCAAHANHHVGQIIYLQRELLGAS